MRPLLATYESRKVADVGFKLDVIIECTGVGKVINDAFRDISAEGVVC